MRAILALEDGFILEGVSFTGPIELTGGEVIFNTTMIGYQELITDPASAGQLLCITYPVIGSYGINPEDMESGKAQVAALIVKECCKEPSNWRSTESLPDFLVRCGVDEKDGKLSTSDEIIPGTWVAPSAQWAMGYALCAFLRPNLHLSNPGVMTSVFPPFWNMYNTLPNPVLKRKQEKEDEDAKPVRRRVIARGVYGELPPEPTAGEDF